MTDTPADTNVWKLDLPGPATITAPDGSTTTLCARLVVTLGAAGTFALALTRADTGESLLRFFPTLLESGLFSA